MKAHLEVVLFAAAAVSSACGAQSEDSLYANRETRAPAHGSPTTTASSASPSRTGKVDLHVTDAGHGDPNATDAGQVNISTSASEEPLPASCLWIGYGIGPDDAPQCDQRHLMLHSFLPCLSGNPDGNYPFISRTVSGVCAAGPQEVQSRCCYDDRAPPEGIDLSSSSPLAKLPEISTLNPESAAMLRIRADEACVSLGQRLGDWYVRYDDDTDLGRLIRYSCN